MLCRCSCPLISVFYYENGWTIFEFSFCFHMSTWYLHFMGLKSYFIIFPNTAHHTEIYVIVSLVYAYILIVKYVSMGRSRQNSSVSIETSYGTDNPVSNHSKGQKISFLHVLKTGCGNHPILYPMGFGSCSTWDNATGASSWPFIFI